MSGFELVEVRASCGKRKQRRRQNEYLNNRRQNDHK